MSWTEYMERSFARRRDIGQRGKQKRQEAEWRAARRRHINRVLGYVEPAVSR